MMIVSNSEDISAVKSDIWSHFHAFLMKSKERNAVICQRTGVIYKYNDVIMRSLRWANALDQLFPDRCPTVLVFASNIPDYPMILHGIFAVGGSVCTLNSHSPEELLAYILNDIKADVIVVENDRLGVVENVTERLQVDLQIFVVGPAKKSSKSLYDIMDSTGIPYEMHREINPKSTAFIFFSSGTTGQPKGIAHTHQSFLTQCTVMSKQCFFQYLRKKDVQEYHPTSFTFSHVVGCVFFYGISAILGDCLVNVDYSDFNEINNIVMKYQVQRIILRPFVVGELASLENSDDILDSVKCILGTGTHSDAQGQAELNRRIPHLRFMDGYGLTETTFITLSANLGEVPVQGTEPLPGVSLCIRSIDTGAVLDAMKIGVLMIKCPWVMKEYINKPMAKKAAFKDGWLNTEDLAYFTKDRRLIVIGRHKDVIVVNGVTVFPEAIEKRLCEHPSVLEAAVIGTPSVENGQLPKAFVILKAPDVSEKQLEYFVNSSTAEDNEKLTGGIHFVNSLPRNPTGKILKKELRRVDWRETHATNPLIK